MKAPKLHKNNFVIHAAYTYKLFNSQEQYQLYIQRKENHFFVYLFVLVKGIKGVPFV